MFLKRPALIFAGLLILATVAACAPLPPATETPAFRQPETLSTTAPAASNTPVPTATTAATPTPAIPDPKTDPERALLYASAGKLFRSAEFTYTMTLTMAPADDASKAALGDEAAELEKAGVALEGSGALEMVDADMGKANLRMDMEMNTGGQQISTQVVVIEDTAWVKMPGQAAWTKVEGEQGRSAVFQTVAPDKMLKDFENAADVQWVEDVSRDGEQVSHLRFTLDTSRMDLDSLTGGVTSGSDLSPEELAAITKDMKPVVDVWLTKAGLELRAQQMTVDWVMPLPEGSDMGDAKIRFLMTMDMQFSKVNKPVTIEPPTE